MAPPRKYTVPPGFEAEDQFLLRAVRDEYRKLVLALRGADASCNVANGAMTRGAASVLWGLAGAVHGGPSTRGGTP